MERNYGIDLLRIFSMINVIILHINKYSKQLTFNYYSPKFTPIWLSEIMAYWAVNAFGIISGIFGYKRYRFSYLIFLWFQYFFYSTFFSLIVYLKNNLRIKKYSNLKIFFPLLSKNHWYVNAYFFMYPLLPFINYGINNLNKKSFRNIILFLIFFCSIGNIIGSILIGQTNYHFLNKGYSSMWLLILYIIGGYLGKYIFLKRKTTSNYKLLYYIIVILIYLFSSFLSFLIFIKLLKKETRKILVNYLSPTIILQSISLILFFSRLNISPIFIKFISFFTPLTFNVTLIHIRLFEEDLIFKKKFFKLVNGLLPKYLFFKIHGLAIIIYLLCSFIDYFRFFLFKILKLRELSIFIENKIPNIIDNILDDI